MNDGNNQELDKVTREIQRTNEKISAIFIAGIALFVLTITTITLPHDTFGLILGGFVLAGSAFIMLFSERKL